MRSFNRFTRLFVIALLLALLACSKSSTNSNDSAIVKLEGNQNVTPFYQNGSVNQILLMGQVKNTGEATAYNVTVNYTLGNLTGSTNASPATLEPDSTAGFAKLVNTNTLPQAEAKFEISWEDEPTAPVTYATSDLEGNWLGAFEFTFPDGRTRNENNLV